MATLAELQTPEAALKAALPESTHIVDAGAAQIRKARMEKKLKEGGASGALESLAGHVNKPDSDRILSENIGVDINPDGTKKLNTQEKARLARGQKAELLNQAAGDGKYDALTNANDKLAIRNRVETIMRRVPQLDIILNGIPAGAARDSFIEGIIKDAAFQAAVREKNNQKLNGVNVGEHEIGLKREEWRQKDEAVKSREAALKNIETQLAALAKKFSENRGVDVSALSAIAKEATINDAVSRSETYRNNTKTAKQAKDVDSYRVYRDKLVDLESQRDKASGAEKIRITQEINRHKRSSVSPIRDISGFDAQQLAYLGNRDTIDRNRMDSQKENLETEKANAQNEVEVAKKERAVADTQRAIAENRRTTDENKFIDSLDGVISEAAVEYLQKKTQESEETRAAEIAKMQEVQADKQKADVQQLLSTRWDRVRARSGTFRRELNRVDKNAVSTDYDTLLTQGPRQLMESIIPAAGAPPAMTTEQRNKLLGDTELQSQFVATLLQKRMETSSFSSTEVRRIVGTTWGKEAINKALDQNTAAKAVITRLEGEGFMKGGFMDWLSKKDDRSILAILGAILGGTAAGIAGGAFAAGAIASAAGAGAEVVGGSMVAGGAAGGIVGAMGGGAAGNRLT